jgi:hypothetical protein
VIDGVRLKTYFAMLRTLLVVLLSFHISFAQQKSILKLFHFSLTPGISTNGIHGSDKTNVFSFNLTSGYTGGTQFLEFGLISNANENGTRGLQFAGLSNITGINAYKGLSKKEIEAKYKSGFAVNLSGAQFSGLFNYVLSDTYGMQSSVGVNYTGNALFGFQLAGLTNLVKKYSFGFQLAGISNVSYESMDGAQLAFISNYTNGGLYGFQMSLFNHAGFIEGRNGYENKDPTAIQIGLFNQAKDHMNGYQVGLINISGRMQGTQIGLLNIHRRGKETGTRDGTSIGLLNISMFGHLALYANELFTMNVEFSTGTLKNGRILKSMKNKYVLNSIIYSSQPNNIVDRNATWGLGYALRKYFYNRSELPGRSEFWFYAYGLQLQHLNTERGKLSKTLNLITKPEIIMGTRLHPKLYSVYVFAAVNWSTHLYKTNNTIAENESLSFHHWPGMSVGLMLH